MIIIAYIPVIHRGYLDFLDQFGDAPLYLISEELVTFLSDLVKDNHGLNALKRDVRKLEDKDLLKTLGAIYPNRKIDVLKPGSLFNQIAFPGQEILMPDEDITRLLKKILFEDKSIKVKFHQTFLRWDMPKSTSKLPPQVSKQMTTCEMVDKEFMASSKLKAMHSPDWWRQVGAVLVKEGDPVLWAFNQHMPTEYETYFSGDPRANFDAGEHIEISKSAHAEGTILANCAKKGISTEGSTLYVTTFPCPNCSHYIFFSGIRKVYFQDGYSLVNSADELLASGIELIKVI